jgi:hypothetical protein
MRAARVEARPLQRRIDCSRMKRALEALITLAPGAGVENRDAATRYYDERGARSVKTTLTRIDEPPGVSRGSWISRSEKSDKRQFATPCGLGFAFR